ncbi:hypothetical protein [Brenneria rubrifaciens]|uniref:hypothetical protein n=1 Tax=Brenneria rubrifaciens TaxID=55213 RepID=UPI001586A718|nr:hypothetical protein [Brenneria rubrifaciens]
MQEEGEQLQALEDGLQNYGEAVKAAVGAIVTIDHNGEAMIRRVLPPWRLSSLRPRH